MQRARAALLGAVAAAGVEAEQFQDGGHGDGGAHGGEVDGGRGRDRWLTLLSLVLGLAQLLAAFAGLGEFAVALRRRSPRRGRRACPWA